MIKNLKKFQWMKFKIPAAKYCQ